MKRKITLILSILLALSLCACAKDRPEAPSETIPAFQTEIPAETAPAEAAAQSDGIPFRYLHRGFTAIRLEDRESFEEFSSMGLKLILTEEDWSDYMGRFCPGIPYFDSFDFSKECLLASVSFGARPTYVQSRTVTRLTVENGYFAFEYEDNPTECLALNTNDTTHFYVEVLIINREGLPPNFEELAYHAAPAAPPEVLSAFTSVLADNGVFYDRGGGQYISIQDYLEKATARIGWPVEIVQAAGVDMDGDGVREVILNIAVNSNVNNAIWVLHYQNGEIHGNLYYHRQLGNIKTDGTFHWSGSSADSGAARLVFDEDEWRKEEVPIGDFDEKEDIHWVPFPCEDIKNLLN